MSSSDLFGTSSDPLVLDDTTSIDLNEAIATPTPLIEDALRSALNRKISNQLLLMTLPEAVVDPQRKQEIIADIEASFPPGISRERSRDLRVVIRTLLTHHQRVREPVEWDDHWLGPAKAEDDDTKVFDPPEDDIIKVIATSRFSKRGNPRDTEIFKSKSQDILDATVQPTELDKQDVEDILKSTSTVRQRSKKKAPAKNNEVDYGKSAVSTGAILECYHCYAQDYFCTVVSKNSQSAKGKCDRCTKNQRLYRSWSDQGL
ncbi:unnamed protein product [Sympodiomycopsis kandeliae]